MKAAPGPLTVRLAHKGRPVALAGPQAYGAHYSVRVCAQRPVGATRDDMDTTAIIRRRLEQALVRRDAGAPFSPDWDTAMAEIDELAARLARLAILARALPRMPVAA